MNLKQKLWVIKILRQAYRAKRLSNFPATAITAMAVLESSYGKSIPTDIETGLVSNNLFGIKSLVKNEQILFEGDNGSVLCFTHEWSKSKGYYLTKAYFRAYKNYKSCFLDFVRIVTNSKRGKKQRYREALKLEVLKDSKLFVHKLWENGYATDKDYLQKIYPIIDQLNRIPVFLLKL